MACLNPTKSFFAFDKHKLIRLAEFYPYDFSATDLMVLDIQLQNYIVDMRLSEDFLELKGVGDLAIKLKETDKHVIYPFLDGIECPTLELRNCPYPIEQTWGWNQLA